jgi:arginyl-tRNA synthetase
MNIELALSEEVRAAVNELFGQEENVILQPTRKDFEGHYTYVFFGLVKTARKAPAEIGKLLGDYLLEKSSIVSRYSVVQGFLNLTVADGAWIKAFEAVKSRLEPANDKGKVLVEYSSPNTNKPLHLGHLRNNFLGFSIAEILKAAGYDVTKACLVNDRGIHICKSMVAYKHFGNGETPASSGLKGDHLVGKYYVAFDKEYKSQIQTLMDGGKTEEEAKKVAPILVEAQEMLVQWEQNDPEVIALWKQMNDWVYQGFNATYKNIGVDFDKTYYESDTYLLGKDIVEEGLAKGVFYKKEDQSVWIDLTEEGLDHKLVLRGDGTSVYITQDLGTTDLKFKDFSSDKSIWVVGNEQDYHFKVLFAILSKLGRSYAEGCYHLSYGMVDLPSGKMKSREGTVVDADELVEEMVSTSKGITEEKGKTEGFTDEQLEDLYRMVALGALKYYLLKVEPKKRMLFNPAESIDFQGNTGPFIQYTHARIKSILRKSGLDSFPVPAGLQAVNAEEIELIFLLKDFNKVIQNAAAEYSPALVANYVYDLAKIFNGFYTKHSVLNEPDESLKRFRLSLIEEVAAVIKKSMGLLGIGVPEKM